MRARALFGRLQDILTFAVKAESGLDRVAEDHLCLNAQPRSVVLRVLVRKTWNIEILVILGDVPKNFNC